MPVRTVRFATPEIDGCMSPPPIANAMLPAVECQLCPALLHNRAATSAIFWDMSFPVETAQLYPGLPGHTFWSAPATNPLVTNLRIIFGGWRMVITPQPSSRVAYVTVADVLHGIYRHLRSTSSEKDFSLLLPDTQRRVTDAYIQRWQRCRIPAEREMERSKGVKNIDFLADSKVFWGLTPTKELGVFQLQVTRSS